MKVCVFDDNGKEVWNHACDAAGNRSGMAIGNTSRHDDCQEKIISILTLALQQAEGEMSGPIYLD